VTRLRIIIIATIVVIVGATAYTRGFGYFTPTGDGVLAMNGNVDIRQVDLGFRVDGRIASMPVEAGARVEAGALLAALDMRPLKDQLAVDDAQIALSSAQLDKQRNGNRAQDIAEAQEKLAEMGAQFIRTKADFDRRSTLVQSGAVSRSDFDTARSQLGVAEAQFRAANDALSLQRAGARSEDIEAAKAQLEQSRAQREKTNTDIADAELRAPNAGVILTRAREPGAIVQTGETVMTLTIDRPMRVRAYVDAIDLSRISPGMAVEITTDGVSKTYHGTIGFISPTAEFTPKTVQTRALRTDLVYRMRVIVDDPDDALRQGQPVTVRVPGARAAQASAP
jgi:HlyD family secretion protein